MLAAEALSTNFRASEDIKGLIINNQSFKILQLTEDITYFIKDQMAMSAALQLLKKWMLLWIAN